MWQRAQVTQASETIIQDVPLALVTLVILSALELIVHENILLEFGASKIKNSTKAHETGKPCEERRSEHATRRAPRKTSVREPPVCFSVRVRPRCRPVAPCVCTG